MRVAERVDCQLAFAEVIGLFAGFDETGAVCRRQFEAILENGERSGLEFAQAGQGVFEAEDFAIKEQPLIALLGDESEGFVESEFFGNGKSEGDEDFTFL